MLEGQPLEKETRPFDVLIDGEKKNVPMRLTKLEAIQGQFKVTDNL